MPIPSIEVASFSLGVGEMAGLVAAMVWSLSSLIWVRVPLSAVGINAIKNLLGSGFLLVHLVGLSFWYRRSLFEASPSSVGWLILSGVVGIVIGDTFFFNSLQMLKPRRALMVASTSPVFAVLLMLGLQGQSFTAWAGLGIVLVIAGVWMVIAERSPSRLSIRRQDRTLGPRTSSSHSESEPQSEITGWNSESSTIPLAGLLMGLAGAFCQASGGLLSQNGMTDCSPIEASFIRIFASCIVLNLWFRYRGVLRYQLREATKSEVLRLVIPATAMGTWIGIWLSQVAFKWTTLAIAQTLLSTSPLFATLWAKVFLKQPVGRIGLVGAFVGIIGVWLVVR